MTVAQHVFFLGLGGIGMSALARHLHSLGHVVGGYDLTPSPLLDRLKEEGVWVGHSDDPDDLPDWARQKTPTLVWTPAVPADFKLKRHFESRGIPALKRAELLGAIARNRPTLAVAGTHGKTTTSSWLADMLMAHPAGCHAFLGGIDAATGTNLLSRPGAEWHVVEADEFDRSFHQLHPTHAAVTNLDPDHLDVYGTEEAFREAFHVFGTQVGQTLIVPHDLPWPHQKTLERFAVVDLGEDVPEGVDHLATLRPHAKSVTFELHRNNPDKICSFEAAPALAGRHNTANALVAAALASHAHVGADVLAHRVESFGGVKRRMEVHWDTPEATYIDDYAHHPSELEALLSAVRSRWPDRHVTMVFQPHLYSRTRDFGAEFARVLGQADRLFLLPIYPAREAPIPGVDAQWLFDNISSPDKHLVASDSIFTSLKACPVDVLVTAGAGDIDRLVPQALQHMQDRRK